MRFREFPRLSGRLLLRWGHLLRELVPRTFWTRVQRVLPELLVGPGMGHAGGTGGVQTLAFPTAWGPRWPRTEQALCKVVN